jgi:hypothetical protein
MCLDQTEGFKSAHAILRDLEYQLSVCDVSTHECEQTAAETAQEIEKHFGMCIDLLVARKATLLKEVSQLVDNQSMCRGRYFYFFKFFLTLYGERTVAEIRSKIEKAIGTCKKTLNAGSVIYKVDAKAGEALLKVL